MPFLRTFGPPALLNDAGEQLLPKGKPLALLAYCATDHRRTISRDECASLLWSDMPAERARHSVRQVIWRLRKLLGDDFSTRDDFITGVGPGVRTDRDEFLAAAHAGNTAAALEFYRGPYLEGLLLPGGDEYDDWLQFERHRLEETLVQVVERAADQALGEERRSEARELAERLRERAPTHLSARRLVIECALATGDVARARVEADALEARALQEGQLLPPRIIQTIARTRQTSPVAAIDTAPAISLDFVGRDTQFAEVMEAWRSAQGGRTGVFFVTGPAGIGKSRLLQVVQRRCAVKPARALLVRANAGEQSVAFGYAALVVRALGALPGAVGVSETSARELVALDPSLTASLKVSAAPWDATEGPRRRALALLDLMQAVTEQQPITLLLDDWHWVDAASRELLTVALGRCETLALLVLVTSRHRRDLPALDVAHTLTLSPLTIDDSLEALRSTGAWPSSPDVTRFLTMIATASRGVPLDLYERLTMAVETEQLRWCDGEWHTDDWGSLANEVAAGSPLSRRLSASSVVEVRALLLLAVAGAPVHAEVLAKAFARLEDGATLPDTLAILESKGFVRRDGPQITLAHDTIADAVHDVVPAESRRQAHGALAATIDELSTSGALPHVTPENVYAALRHALNAGDPELSARLLAWAMTAARLRGDRRSARVLLRDMVGAVPAGVDEARLLRSLPLWRRWARPSPMWVGVVSVAVAVLALVLSWRLAAAPPLRIMQAPSTVGSASSYGPDIVRLVPALMIATDDGSDSVTVRVTSPDGRSQVVAGGELRTPRGTVSLASLRLRLRDSAATLQIGADGHRPVQVVVRRNFAGTDLMKGPTITAFFVEGTFGTRRITPDHPTLRVRPNEQVQGVVQMRYTSALSAASIWVSFSPSWGDPQTQGRELQPLSTPTLSDIVDLPIVFVAPDRPGSYWIIVIVSAEPSGGFGLSGTNWTFERPVWGDGNELADLPDSTLMQANRDGYAMRMIGYPAGWQRNPGDCLAPSGDMKMCRQTQPMFAIPVEVPPEP